MIRDAAPSDIPALVGMAARFAEKAGLTTHVGFDADSVAGVMASLIESDLGICLIGDDCMAGGLLYPHPCNARHLTGSELFWWSEGRDGLRLWAEMEARAKAKGAHSFVMVALDRVNPEAMGKTYRRRGYAPLETHYVKVF